MLLRVEARVRMTSVANLMGPAEVTVLKREKNERSLGRGLFRYFFI